jgi:vanillate O-demethylase monooxygenase subunit
MAAAARPRRSEDFVPTHIRTVSLTALRDFWHPVAFSSEVTAQPQRIYLLEERLVLYRTQGGQVGALNDLCIHRGTPLSLGWVDGERLVCAYHGWTYDTDGRVVRIPSIPAERGIPAKACVASFKTVEKYGLVWVCLGDPRTEIADFPEFDDPAFRRFTVESEEWAASAPRLIENFVDTAHFAWVHEGILGQRDKPLVPPVTVSQDGMQIVVDLDMDVGTDIHQGKNNVWDIITLPFTVRQVRTDAGGGRHVVFLAVSPTTNKSLRRFVYKLRDYALDQPDDDYIAKSALVAAQDRAIVEEQRPEELPVDLTEEMHVRGPDDAAVVFRRAMGAIGVDIA